MSNKIACQQCAHAKIIEQEHTTRVVFSVPDGYGQQRAVNELFFSSALKATSNHEHSDLDEYEDILEIHELSYFGENTHARFIEAIHTNASHKTHVENSYPATPTPTPKVIPTNGASALSQHAAILVATLKQLEKAPQQQQKNQLAPNLHKKSHRRSKSDPSATCPAVPANTSQAKK